MLSGRVMAWDQPGGQSATGLKSLSGASVSPWCARRCDRRCGSWAGSSCSAQTIEEAIERARRPQEAGFRYSYDMLGEGAKTAADAGRHLAGLPRPLERIAAGAARRTVVDRPTLSIKLSALHPRYEQGSWRRVRTSCCRGSSNCRGCARPEGRHRRRGGKRAARAVAGPDRRHWPVHNEARRLGRARPRGAGLPKAGDPHHPLARRTGAADLAADPGALGQGCLLGHRGQAGPGVGFTDYPVFTRKVATDVSYLACAKRLLDGGDAFYPQFATHNAHTIAP